MTTRKGGAAPRKRTALPDLVYPFKDVSGTDELRYSLRSLATNADGLFRKVWIVGEPPEWATNLEQIPHRDRPGKMEDFRARVTAATAHPGVSDTFLLMNDDFYLARPVTKFETFHSGPALEHYARMAARKVDAGWLAGVKTTLDWMTARGHVDMLARQGHRPLLWDRKKLAATLAAYPANQVVEMVGLYAEAGAGGVGSLAPNMKVTNRAQYHSKVAQLGTCPWLSSSDEAFADGLIGGHIRALFPNPCRFEKG